MWFERYLAVASSRSIEQVVETLWWLENDVSVIIKMVMLRMVVVHDNNDDDDNDNKV